MSKPRLTTPYSAILPPLSSDELEALKQDIRRQGIRQPIEVSDRHEVLDGHHRLAIARRLRKPYSIRVVEGSGGWGDAEKAAYVYKANQTRRNLSFEQKFQAARPIAKRLRDAGKTQQQVADLLGVSRALGVQVAGVS